MDSQPVTSPIPLDAVTFPLYGHRLIEASAGTGKTYTITNLYLRLVTGHGTEDNRFVSPLSPAEILVVTFTEAATQELRERIRARIHKALRLFSKQLSPDEINSLLASDALLKELYKSLPDHEQVARRLLQAERQMDEAAIFTIHGFCYRMLSQFAFESRSLFNRTLIADESELLNQASCDFWRQSFYNTSKEISTEIYKYWKTPEHLLLAIRQWLHYTDLQVITFDNAGFQARKKHLEESSKNIKEKWASVSHELKDIILNSGVSKRTYTQRRINQWLEKMASWCESDAFLAPDCIEKFSASFLKSKTPPKAGPPFHSIFEVVDEYRLLANTYRDIFIKMALSGIKARLLALKVEKRIMGFDDLLSWFDAAIIHKNGTRLKQVVRKTFPVAIIDEFQDTDSLQYRIFNTLYPDEKREYALFMIGDPKQAIYAFRGADIFSYINARRNTRSRYTLPVNWRSTPDMVKACNTFFSSSPAPFIYEKDIPFTPAISAPAASKRFLESEGKPSCAMTIWCQPDNKGQPVSLSDYVKYMSRATACEITRLLELSEKKQCEICEETHRRPLEANDIAILVRTGNEAQSVRQELASAGIASVYMSERDRVFDTQEAMDLYRVLNACVHPENESLLRSALATGFFELDAQTLDNLREDEKTWETVIKEFSQYHVILLKQGVLSLFRQMLFQRNIAHRLLNSPSGERRLTDIRHLGELLSSAEQMLDSPQALLHWLWVRIQRHTEDPAYQLHLESDRNLVRIITIHKSKGLEFPIVFIPFTCQWKSVKKEKNPDKKTGYFFHDERTTHPVLDLTCAEENYQLAEKERLAEDLRLLYVATTRAIYRCYIGVGPVRKHKIGKNEKETHLNQTAIGYLLNNNETIIASELATLSKSRWTENEQIIEVVTQMDFTGVTLENRGKKDKQRIVRHFSGQIEKNWYVTSYSALGGSHHTTHSGDYLLHKEVKESALINHEEKKTIFTFPKGARSGVFLHGLFEKISFVDARQTPPSSMIEKALDEYGFEAGWRPTLEILVDNVLNARLVSEIDKSVFCLGYIADTKKYVEMEFYLPASVLYPDVISRIIKAYDPLSQKAANLNFESVKGMLKGFIDLVFEHNGRYYIVDYKSNYLGDNCACYNQSGLEQAMIEHRYDFQYQLYTLALHRLLKNRLKSYDYKNNIGGVFYLFLRGMRKSETFESLKDNKCSQDYGVFHTLPPKEMIEDLDRVFSGKREVTQ